MNKRTMKKGLAIVLALVMVFAMTATAFADTTGTATINYYIYDETEGASWKVDTATVNAGQSLYDALNSAQSHYEPNWQESTDVFNGETVYYLTSFMGYKSNVNVDHQYNADGSGWSIDWGLVVHCWTKSCNAFFPERAKSWHGYESVYDSEWRFY